MITAVQNTISFVVLTAIGGPLLPLMWPSRPPVLQRFVGLTIGLACPLFTVLQGYRTFGVLGGAVGLAIGNWVAMLTYGALVLVVAIVFAAKDPPTHEALPTSKPGDAD